MTDKSERMLLCPFRDDIRDMKKITEATHDKVKDMYDRLFVKKNGDPLSSQVEANTSFRESIEKEKTYDKRSKWRRRSFWLGIISLLITQTIILFKIFGGL